MYRMEWYHDIHGDGKEWGQIQKYPESQLLLKEMERERDTTCSNIAAWHGPA